MTDECHRTQFGETHKCLKIIFITRCLVLLVHQSLLKMLLKTNLVKEQLKSCLVIVYIYVITDAIRDENVLRFSIEYVGKYKQKQSSLNFVIDVEGIDTKELLESDDRLNKITDYIISHHNTKTHSRIFTFN